MKTAKDMYKVYAGTSTEALLKNRMRKQVALIRLKGVGGYWANKERVRLEHMIKQIDAVIEARAQQIDLF